MSDSQVSEAALRRKQIFMAAKEKAGGAEALEKAAKLAQYRLFFDEDGLIVCMTKNPEFEVDPNWLTYDFSQDQLEVLVDKDLAKYCVMSDPKDSNVKYISLRPLETLYVSSQDDFLSEIERKKIRGWEIQAEITKTHLKIAMSKSALKQYEDIYPISATIKGQRLLKFYITAPNDPHIVFSVHFVSLADLITDSAVEIELPFDLREYSLYTSRAFEKYVRK